MNVPDPIFKPGDLIVDKDPDEYGRAKVVAIKDERYILEGGSFIWIREQNSFRVVGHEPTLEELFDKEYSKFSNDPDADHAFPIDLSDYREFAYHFFELGLKIAKDGRNS